MGKKENESSTNDAICTPASVFEPVLKALGIERFDLDPCSHPNAIVPVKQRVLLPEYRGQIPCPTCGGSGRFAIGVLGDGCGDCDGRGHIHAADAAEFYGTCFGDGLDVDWSGKDVWKNPPYSQLQHTVPTKKHPNGKYPWLHKLAYEAKRGVAFVPSRTSSRWWHHWVLGCERADILVQLKGRVKHHGEKWGSPFHQVLVAYSIFDPYAVVDVSLQRWREAFDHPNGGFVTDLREMRR